MYNLAFMPSVGENGGIHRISGYRMGYAVDEVTASTGKGKQPFRLPIDVGGANTGKSKVYAGTLTTDGSQAPVSGSSGSGAPHNNIPPYLAVYMWWRTA